MVERLNPPPPPLKKGGNGVCDRENFGNSVCKGLFKNLCLIKVCLGFLAKINRREKKLGLAFVQFKLQLEQLFTLEKPNQEHLN